MKIKIISPSTASPAAIGHKGPGRPAVNTLLNKARSGQMTEYQVDPAAMKNANPMNVVLAAILSMKKNLPVYRPFEEKQAILSEAMAKGTSEALDAALVTVLAPTKYEEKPISSALGTVILTREEVNENLNRLCAKIRAMLGLSDIRVIPLVEAEAAEAAKAAAAEKAIESEGVVGSAADDDSADDDSADDDSADDDSADDDSADDDSADDDSAADV